MFIFGYNVSYFDEVDRNTRHLSGLVCGVDMTSAVRSLERWYGVDNVESINIFYLLNNYGEVVENVVEKNDINKIFNSLEE